MGRVYRPFQRRGVRRDPLTRMNLTLINIIGSIAAVLTTASWLPQLLRTWPFLAAKRVALDFCTASPDDLRIPAPRHRDRRRQPCDAAARGVDHGGEVQGPVIGLGPGAFVIPVDEQGREF